MSLPVEINPHLLGSSAAATGYQIERSLRFNSADSAYLNRTFGATGDQQKWTWSAWVKGYFVRASGSHSLFGVTNGDGGTGTEIRFTAAGAFNFYCQGSGLGTSDLVSTALYRDPSAWYHIVVAVDTTQATDTNRIKIYVNGIQVTAFSTATYQSQNSNTYVGTTSDAHIIGKIPYASFYYNGYMTEVHFVNAQQLSPTDFGAFNATTGVWQPKAYTGSYGTNGFYLNFSDSSGVTSTTLGADSSGNGNNWTPNNFSVTAGAGNDSLVDTPTPYGEDTGVGGEVRGNYDTWNALVNNSTLSNGNLQIAGKGSTVFYGSVGTIAMSSGKWYWEITNVSNTDGMTGIIEISQAYAFAGATPSGTTYVGYQSRGYAYHANGNKYNNASSSAYGATYTTNDIIGVAFDADAGTLVFYKNGVSQGTAYTVASGYSWFPADNVYVSDSKAVNFGQRPFAYTAPSGFKALCTQNLPEPTIADGGDYFNTVLYTGTGASNNSVTGVGFQPDWVWIKARSYSGSHVLQDAVRPSYAYLISNATSAENTNSQYDWFKSFDSDGFTVSTSSTAGASTDEWNGSGQSFVAWNWKANGAGSSNTAGTITSTVSVNTTSGFSIVTWTGTGAVGTIGHGLGVAPSMVIVKNRTTSVAGAWPVYHQAIGATNYLFLDLTDAQSSVATPFNDTAPTSTVFSVDGSDRVNKSGNGIVAYCFAPVAGYSAFGSYTGNGSADGPFVYTGFRPAFLMIKIATGDTAQWVMYDTARDTYNAMDLELQAESSNAENQLGSNPIDCLSNGFKIRSSTLRINRSTSTFIYMAFAENPFKYSLAR